MNGGLDTQAETVRAALLRRGCSPVEMGVMPVRCGVCHWCRALAALDALASRAERAEQALRECKDYAERAIPARNRLTALSAIIDAAVVALAAGASSPDGTPKEEQ